MPVGFRNPTIHYYWFAVLIPWFRFLFLSQKPVVHEQENNQNPNHDHHVREEDDHYGFEYDIEAQITMNRISSAEGLDSERSISGISFHSQSESSFSSSSSLTFTRCRFRDSFDSSNSSPDGSPSSIDIAPCLNESFQFDDEERIISESPSSSTKVKNSLKVLKKTKKNSSLSKLRKSRTDEDYLLHPVTKILREQELAKQILGLAIPMAMGLMAYYNPMAMTLATRSAFLLLSVGFAALWNGNLLHETYPGFSHKIELLGYACMLTAFYSLVAYFLRFTYLALVPVICLIFSLVPLGMAFYHRNCASTNIGSNIQK